MTNITHTIFRVTTLVILGFGLGIQQASSQNNPFHKTNYAKYHLNRHKKNTKRYKPRNREVLREIKEYIANCMDEKFAIDVATELMNYCEDFFKNERITSMTDEQQELLGSDIDWTTAPTRLSNAIIKEIKEHNFEQAVAENFAEFVIEFLSNELSHIYTRLSNILLIDALNNQQIALDAIHDYLLVVLGNLHQELCLLKFTNEDERETVLRNLYSINETINKKIKTDDGSLFLLETYPVVFGRAYNMIARQKSK